jgi:NAD(P)-dependent dehydrogenase (short-subunit alcohol dehydrogenase family)
MFELKGKTALVAGGAGYLGQALCRALAGQGAAIMVADVARERAGGVAADLNEQGGRADAVELDVADEASSRQAVERTVAEFGGLDVLVNATCFAGEGKTLDDLSAAEFDRANRVNLTGTFVLARDAARAMPAGGSIVLFASMYGLVSPDPSTYCAPMLPNPIEYGVGKAGIVQMTKYLAVAWAARGIRVNAIAPGPFPNPSVQKEFPDFIDRLSAKVPLGRIGRPGEVTGVVAFLASDAASYLTGVTVPVDGGWTAW